MNDLPGGGIAGNPELWLDPHRQKAGQPRPWWDAAGYTDPRPEPQAPEPDGTEYVAIHWETRHPESPDAPVTESEHPWPVGAMVRVDDPGAPDDGMFGYIRRVWRDIDGSAIGYSVTDWDGRRAVYGKQALRRVPCTGPAA